MVRTIDEESCSSCGSLTNNYDQCMGRVCPGCATNRATEFGKHLALQAEGNFFPFQHMPSSFALLQESNKRALEHSNPVEPLIDHSNDIEISAFAYHISNAFWEQWLETTRELLKNPQVSQEEKRDFLLVARNLFCDITTTASKYFALKDHLYPLFALPNEGARKNCTHYAECIAQLDWKTDQKRRGSSLKTCPDKCGFYTYSYSVWAWGEKKEATKS